MRNSLHRCTTCEDCGEETTGVRRIRCCHCHQLVCGYCWHHIHRCEPGHERKDCRDLKRIPMGVRTANQQVTPLEDADENS